MNNNNYGFLFNDITIENNKLIKKSKNDFGSMKIEKEIGFYNNIIINKINIPIPKIYKLDISNSLIEMKYLNNYSVLTNKFYKMNYEITIEKIKKEISVLHNYYIKNVDKEEFLLNILIETKDKITNRYYQTNWEEIINFNKIKKVNNISIKNLNFYLDSINEKITNIINSMSEYLFCYIHGDIHLGNILINDNEKICFIDPRGYFGNNNLIGLKEYDYAKLLFGISGYSIFDEMIINELEIIDNNLNIDFIDKYCIIYESNLFDEFTKLLSLSIWLGNNSNFINENKKIMSLMISYYLCEKYL